MGAFPYLVAAVLRRAVLHLNILQLLPFSHCGQYVFDKHNQPVLL